MPPFVRADQWSVKARLLLVCKWLGTAAFVAFMASWVIGVLVTPSPKWVNAGSLVAIGVGFASILLYHLVNHLVGDPIEEEHWELETPTSVSNLVRQNRVGPLFVWIVLVVTSYAALHAKNTLHLRTLAAAPLALLIGTTCCWLLMFAFAKGWVHDED
jgi:hypothetical protein